MYYALSHCKSTAPQPVLPVPTIIYTGKNRNHCSGVVPSRMTHCWRKTEGMQKANWEGDSSRATMPTKQLARPVHSRGDGLSSPWGDQDVVAIAYISHSPTISNGGELLPGRGKHPYPHATGMPLPPILDGTVAAPPGASLPTPYPLLTTESYLSGQSWFPSHRGVPSPAVRAGS
jgi:hypothetical protein